MDLKAIEEKVSKGEELTAEEESYVKGLPVDGTVDAEEAAKETGIKKAPEAGKEKEGEKPEETPSEEGKESKTSKPTKNKEDEDPELTDSEKKEVEELAEKPIEEVDLENMKPKKRSLYWQMRDERRKRQDEQRRNKELQDENERLKFERAQRAAREKSDAEARERAQKEKEEKDPLEGRDEEDFLTVGEVKKILAQQTGKKTESKAEPEKTETPDSKSKTDPNEEVNRLRMRNWVLEGKAVYSDFDEVVALADELLEGDKRAAEEVKEAILNGGKPGIVTYKLVKQHPRFKEVFEAKHKKTHGTTKTETKPDAETNKERAERIQKNQNKAVTTGSGGGTVDTGEYTLQELLDMSEDEFAKLPKATRLKVMETLGA